MFTGWDIFVTAIATSITAAVAIMLYLLNKPRVKLISVEPIHWFYIYEGGTKKTGAGITTTLKVKNNGGVDTFCEAKFETKNHEVFIAKEFEVGKNGAVFEGYVALYTPKGGNLPNQEEPLEGILSLTPWGNRTFLIGRKTIKTTMTVPYDLSSKPKEVTQ